MYGKTGVALEDTLSVAAFTRMAIAWKVHGDFSLSCIVPPFATYCKLDFMFRFSKDL